MIQLIQLIGLIFNQSGASYSALDLTGITAAGIYFEHDLWDARYGQ